MTGQSHHAEDLDEHSVNHSVDGVVARHGASATRRDVWWASYSEPAAVQLRATSENLMIVRFQQGALACDKLTQINCEGWPMESA